LSDQLHLESKLHGLLRQRASQMLYLRDNAYGKAHDPA
jgi:hypothetical protein